MRAGTARPGSARLRGLRGTDSVLGVAWTEAAPCIATKLISEA